MLARLYGLPTPKPLAMPVADQWVIHNGINQLYLNDVAISQCSAPLLGAVLYKELLHVLCHDELLLLNPDGELLENISSVLGLPDNAQALALHDDQLLIKTAAGIVLADLMSLQWQATDSTPEHWPTPQKPPAQLVSKVSAEAPAIDLEQLLLDLHSGRLFGGFGVLIMDLVAILLIVLSITGFIAWNTSRKIRKVANQSRQARSPQR